MVFSFNHSSQQNYPLVALKAYESADYENVLIVRARRREVLEMLFPGSEIFVTESSDYRYRLFADHAEVAVVLVAQVFSIDYGNFKAATTDGELHALYADFW